MTDILTLSQPEGWKLHRLGQLFEERKEKVSDKDYPPLSVTMGGIVPQLDTAAKSDDSDNRKLVRRGDYAINSRSDRKGSGGVSELDGSVSLITIVLKPRGILPRFAHHLLRSTAFQEEFYRWGHGIVADLWTTRFADMKNIRLFLPNVETQKSIADFLDRETARIDQLIEKKQRILRLASSKLSAEVDARIMSLSDAPSQPLHRFCRIVTGKTPSRADEENFSQEIGIPWATPANLGSFEPIIDTKEKLTPQGAVGQIVVPRDTVLVNGIGASIGKIGFSGCNMSFNQQIHGILQIRKLLQDRFLFFVLNTRKEEIVSLASNTTIPIINAERFGRIAVPLPDHTDQMAVVQQLETVVSRIGQLSESVACSIGRLREFRAALITAAVTGQIDVATWGRQGQTDRRLDQIEEAMRA